MECSITLSILHLEEVYYIQYYYMSALYVRNELMRPRKLEQWLGDCPMLFITKIMYLICQKLINEWDLGNSSDDSGTAPCYLLLWLCIWFIKNESVNETLATRAVTRVLPHVIYPAVIYWIYRMIYILGHETRISNVWTSEAISLAYRALERDFMISEIRANGKSNAWKATKEWTIRKPTHVILSFVQLLWYINPSAHFQT